LTTVPGLDKATITRLLFSNPLLCRRIYAGGEHAASLMEIEHSDLCTARLPGAE
jgi:hypothetical protein